MVQSLNSQADFHTKAYVLQGFSQKHGHILIGNQAFEFYNDRNPQDYIQIPWHQIRLVRAQLFLRDRYIRGFTIDTKEGLSVSLVVVNAGQALKVMRNYIGPEKIVRQEPVISLTNIRQWLRKHKP